MAEPAAAPARPALATAQTWVVKIGSALLTAGGEDLAAGGLASWCSQIAAAVSAGRHMVLVSSGAVAEGCRRLGLAQRPTAIHELQAAAAVGQSGLIEAYERAFARHRQRSALVLLTHDDLANRERYLNARATLTTLLKLGVVPIINENDSVATEEIKLGDNDTLAGMVTSLLAADVLALLTDRAGLHQADPAQQPTAPLVRQAAAADAALDAMAGAGTSRLGRGGMVTKLAAARLAARAGAHTVIADGRERDVLGRLRQGEALGTLLTADVAPLDARKRWIANQLRARGALTVDDGAARAIARQGVSILPAGAVATEGSYRRGDMIRVYDIAGREIGQGLMNYDAAATRRLLGCNSREIESVLGYGNEPELIHCDNLVVATASSRRVAPDAARTPATSDWNDRRRLLR